MIEYLVGFFIGVVGSCLIMGISNKRRRNRRVATLELECKKLQNQLDSITHIIYRD